MREVLVAIMLIWNTYLDIRYREVSFWSAFLVSIGGILLRCSQGNLFTMDIVWSVLPGTICLLLAVLSKQAIGFGDAFIILAMGANLCAENMVSVCVVAIVLCGILAAVLLIFCHWKKKDTLPFVPFLLLGYLVTEIRL